MNEETPQKVAIINTDTAESEFSGICVQMYDNFQKALRDMETLVRILPENRFNIEILRRHSRVKSGSKVPISDIEKTS